MKDNRGCEKNLQINLKKKFLFQNISKQLTTLSFSQLTMDSRFVTAITFQNTNLERHFY